MKKNEVYILGAVLITFLLFWKFSMNATGIDIPDKHPLDKTEYRKLTLENGLKVILVSNPKYNISAASMNVKVGSLSDPKDAQGLAHFLEHMLFLGTEKYPDVEDYKMYLSKNGGYSNAYTAEDHTNYLFEVIHEAFEGALDRFSQFFIAPAFNPDYTKREQNAVNSEFQKNLEHDYWRMRQIKRAIYNEDHPANHFEIGSLETLEKVDRQVLLDFHQKYYSANQMALALLSKYSLDEMESWARTYFSPIKNNQAEEIAYPTDYLSEKDAIRLIRVKPVKDKKELGLEFPLPLDMYSLYDGKPMRVLGSLIGHEGKGSLLSLLKEKGLATGLSGGGSPDTPDYGSAGIHVQLTQKGVDNYQEVLEYFFSYVKMLKKEGFKKYLFEEQKTIARLEEVFSDKGEGTWKAVSFANDLAFYPMEVAHRVEYHFGSPDPEGYNHILSYIRPDNMLCVLSDSNQETPLEEFWYKSKYNYEEIIGEEYEALLDPPVNSHLHLPEPNPYLPENAQLLPEPEKEISHPTLIEASEGLKLYYGQDTEFQRPKASINYKIFIDKQFTDIHSQTLLNLYVASVKESMNEASYPARLAGMEFFVSNDEEGISITVNGYHDTIDELLQEILNNMKDLSLPEERFNALKDKKIRDWKNVALGNAYQIAREKMRTMIREIYFDSAELAAAAENVSLQDVQSFSKTLLERGYVQALVYGNISQSQAVKNTNLIYDILDMKPLAKEEAVLQRRLSFKEGDDLNVVVESEVNNSCLWRLQYFGENSIEEEAQAKVLGRFVEPPFFLEMRTNRQLGYIVWGGAASHKKSSYFIWVIQSGNHSADNLSNQASEFTMTLPDSLRKTSDAEFAEIKNAVIEKIKEKPTSIAEKAGRYVTAAFELDGNFNRDEMVIEAVENLSKERAIEILEKLLHQNTRKRATVLFYAKEHEKELQKASLINDVNSWKRNRNFQ
ncbi:MAG: insulinase family protein [Candidatus Marinimicrobia bacterium]|nr:insulinase family protein [Candidatus Neomarinimicrobiota bacterium]